MSYAARDCRKKLKTPRSRDLLFRTFFYSQFQKRKQKNFMTLGVSPQHSEKQRSSNFLVYNVPKLRHCHIHSECRHSGSLAGSFSDFKLQLRINFGKTAHQEVSLSRVNTAHLFSTILFLCHPTHLSYETLSSYLKSLWSQGLACT